MYRLLVVLLLVFGSCRSGLIDCPDPAFAKLRHSRVKPSRVKDSQYYAAAALAEDAKERKQYEKYLRERQEMVQKRVSRDVEEWDCPKPGERRRVSKQVRKKMERTIKNQQDSVKIVLAPKRK